MSIGSRIKAAREAKKMTQEELGAACGTTKQSIFKYETGVVTNIPLDKLEKIANVLDMSPATLMGWENSLEASRRLPSSTLPFNASHKAPILGSIPAGYPVLALEDIEGYADIPYSDDENYFFLRVNGESMKNAGIHTGDLVLIRRQKCADDGQVVAARINGDEATLKRYKRQGESVILIPENPEFEPRVVPIQDFEIGDAEIIGVALEVRHTL